jgi:hypothetical protein
MARLSVPARSVVAWRTYVGAGVSVIGALIAIILLTLVMTELEIMSGIDPAPQIVRA